MRATELLGCAVYDRHGELIGRIHDLRFEATAPARKGATGWTCRLTGLSCGKKAPVGHRLGYGTGDMAGPRLFSALFRRSRERALQIDWQDVVRVDRRRVDVAGRRGDYEGRRQR